MRLIDATPEVCEPYLYDHLDDLLMIAAQNAIDDMPTVDAVPVVRCKDCKWYQLDPWGYKYQCEKIYDVADGDLDAFYFRPSPDHFCAYGERKEGMSDGEKQ